MITPGCSQKVAGTGGLATFGQQHKTTLSEASRFQRARDTRERLLTALFFFATRHNQAFFSWLRNLLRQVRKKGLIVPCGGALWLALS